ncbi:MAG: SPASM domain-containing protein [bacterium]|nr:SPASM domain-containing protein [bacterium]
MEKKLSIIDDSKFSLFSFNGENFLIGFCGGIYSADSSFYEYLSSGKASSEEEAADMKNEYLAIQKAEDDASDIPPMPGRTLRALCLNVTSSCNLGCIYCFANPETDLSCHMTFETAMKSLDFLIAKGSMDSMFQIDFFGGEPLLNFEMIKRFVPAAREKVRKIKFTLTTNAVLLDEEKLEWLNREKISLILSLDGDKRTNDLTRRDRAGRSVWEKSFNNIKRAIESRNGADYYVRGTFTPDSLDLAETCRFFIDNGIYRFSLEPAKGKETDPWAVSEKDLEKICCEYEKMALLIKEKKEEGLPVDYFHFNIYLDAPLCSPRRLSGCGAGVEYVSIASDGRVFPCHRLHSPEFSMGTVFDEKSEKFDAIREKFSSCSIESKKACSKCWARFYCSGGCHSDAVAKNGDIYKPAEYDCALQKKRTQCAIWLASSLLKSEK